MAMVEIPHVQLRINYKGPIQFREWYKLVYNWLLEKDYHHIDEYGDLAPPNDINFEDYLFEWKLPGGQAINNWIWWRTAKDENAMFRWVLKIDFQTLVLKPAEVMHNGKKIKANNGEINLFIRPILVIDPDKIWGKNWLTKELFDLFRRKYFLEQIEEERRKLYDEAVELHDRSKQSLGLHTLVHREQYHIGDKAYPDV